MTIERVIYARKGGLALEAPHTLLGVAGEGAWASVSDETLQALLAGGRPLRILYFGADEYAHAMRALSAAEIEYAVRRRLEVFSDRVAAETLSALMDRERASLAIAAITGQRRYVDDCLGRLAHLNGHGYFDTMPLVEAVRISVVAEVALLEAEAEAGNGAAAARRQSQAQALAQARARLGEPAFARALPFVDLIFVFAVSPVKPERLELLHHDKVPHAVLDGRLLVALPRRVRDDLATDGTVTRVAADAGDFVVALDQTQAQRDRDLRELAARAGDPRVGAAALWRQRAAQCAIKRWLVADRRCDEALVTALRAQLDADVAELMTTAPPATGETLAASHARAAADARLFAILARQGGLPSLAGDFDETLARLTAAGAGA